MVGIYKITSPSNRIYIGQSINIETRFSRYKSKDCKSQTILYNSFVKYGVENHKFEIITLCYEEQLNEFERDFQEAYNVIGKNGLNCMLTKTTDKSGQVSESFRQKHIGKIITDEAKIKMRNAKLGGKLSKEHKLKLSLNNAGSRKVINIETGEIFKTILDAADENNMKRSTLTHKLLGTRTNNTNLRYYEE